jgi:predicted nucleotidyltransferase
MIGLSKRLKKILPVPEEQLIVLMKFGSHLYGTNGPDSDKDYKGVYLPTKEQILLNKIPKSVSFHSKTDKAEGVRNNNKDVDVEVYSLHYFMELLYKGETVALDMIHAPADWPLMSSDLWEILYRSRRRFHTKNLRAFVSYARKQAAKYGIKGSRMADVKVVLDFLQPIATINDTITLGEMWEDLPALEHVRKLEGDEYVMSMYQVVGKKFGSTCKVSYVLPILHTFYEQYGHRAKLAAENKGIDWKAVSHAMRAAIQVGEIMKYGDIVFPLRQAELLKKIKYGEYDYSGVVAPLLEAYMDDCEKFSELSNLPEEVNRKQWDEWLVRVLEGTVFQHEGADCANLPT